MNITQYRFMTDEDLLGFCSERRQQSPLIEELCQRLENYVSKEDEEETSKKAKASFFKCKACDAEFKVDIVVNDELVELNFI